MNQPVARKMIDLLILWNQLGDVPTFPESNDEYEVDSIELPFLHFGVGTHREDIWHWFEAQNPQFLVGEVMERKHLVIYSAQDAKDSDGIGGFWSNEDGWTGLTNATVFSKDEVTAAHLRLPISDANDSQWLTFSEAIRMLPEEQRKDFDDVGKVAVAATAELPGELSSPTPA